MDKIHSLDPKKLDVTSIYKILIGSVVPRPIALISTISPEGILNVAPFSFFNGVSSNPPCISVSFSRHPDGTKKDTLKNIEATSEFVVNSTNEWIIEEANHASGNFPSQVSEFDITGLTPLPSIVVKAPRVKESAIQMECKFYKSVEVGDGTAGSATLVIGQIVQVHVGDEVYQDGKILIEKLKPISRLGGLNYGKVSDVFALARPDVQRGK